MREKKMKKFVEGLSSLLAVGGVSFLTAFGLELMLDKGENKTILFLSLIVASVLSIGAVVLDGVADILEEKIAHNASLAYQAWQKWQLWVEDRRMKQNIDVK